MSRDVGFLLAHARGGTMSLAQTLKPTPELGVFHDRTQPTMNKGGVIEKMNNGSREEIESAYRGFLVFVREKVEKTLKDNQQFFESNSAFLLTYGEFFRKQMPERLRIIRMMRNPILVGRSRENGFDVATGGGPFDGGWTVRPWFRRNHWQLPRRVFSKRTGFEGALWHTFEVEIRANQYLKRCDEDGIPWFALRTTQLNDLPTVRDMLNFLGVKLVGEVRQMAESVHNSSGSGKYDRKIEEYLRLYDRFVEGTLDGALVYEAAEDREEIHDKLMEVMEFWFEDVNSLEEGFAKVKEEITDNIIEKDPASGDSAVRAVDPESVYRPQKGPWE